MDKETTSQPLATGLTRDNGMLKLHTCRLAHAHLVFALVITNRRVSVAREARSTAPKAPRPRSGLGTRPFNFFRVPVSFNVECLASTRGVI